MVINMSILEKLNNLINTLESSPSELQKFVAEYEDYRNKVIFNEIKNNKEIFISPPEFSFVSDEEVDRVIMFDRETKLSSMPRKEGNGVSCFFLEIDDLDRHKKIINFLIENNLIPKKKNGDYYNLSFKLDEQTRNNEYNESFKSVLKLEELIDLRTGEWKQ